MKLEILRNEKRENNGDIRSVTQFLSIHSLNGICTFKRQKLTIQIKTEFSNR